MANKKIGKTIPTSAGIVPFLVTFISIKNTPQLTREMKYSLEVIIPKFKPLRCIGSFMKINIAKKRLKNGKNSVS